MRLIDADRLKDIMEYCILCNIPADVMNTKEEEWNAWVQKVIDREPTVGAIPKAELKKIIEPLRHLESDKMSDVERALLEVVDE